MAIQSQFYPSSINDTDTLLTPFCNNNGFSADGFNIAESCFYSQQKHHQQQLEQHLQQFYNESQMPIDNCTLSYYSPSFYVQNSQFERQKEQIDQYIKLQNVKLRHMVQEQGKKQVTALLRKVEVQSLFTFKEKDQEIAEATKKRVELEEYIRRLEAENQAWKKMALENEAIALSIHRTLEEMRERSCSFGGGVVGAPNDVESCCDESNEEENNKNFEKIMRDDEMLCRNCHCGKLCYLFLPCRHLSSCKDCDAFLKACPVCRMPKKASIEALIF